MARGEFSTPPLLLSKLGRIAGPPFPPLLWLWRAWSQAGPLSPRRRFRTSRRSCLTQGGPTSCRSQERSENGFERSGYCRWACLLAWCGNRHRCGLWVCGLITTFPPLHFAAASPLALADAAYVPLLLELPLFASLILLINCLNVGVVVLLAAELVAVSLYVSEASPRPHADAASRDTS